MILEGNERGYGAQLARHLLNPRDNDHVTVHSLTGFIADDLTGAFAEAEAISQATQCQKYLFSLSLNPPPGQTVPVEVFEETIRDVESKLGLVGQPRAIVFHEKNGRRHAHCVWSRIDGERLRAINISLYKRKLTALSRELYLTHDWEMPQGFRDAAKRDPLNFSRAEAGQAQRNKLDPKVQKAMFRQCWDSSDSRSAFSAALKDQGYILARGDRRGFVAVDGAGKIWSLSRWCGVRPKEMRARLGSENTLPSLDDAVTQRHDLPSPKEDAPNPAFEQRRAKLVTRQREGRTDLLKAQETRRIKEQKQRNARLPKGLRAVLARVTRHYQIFQREFETEAAVARLRDSNEQHQLVETHLAERRALHREFLQSGISQAFRAALHPDPRQELVLPTDDLPFSKAQLTRDPTLILEYISKTKAQFNRTDILRELAKRIDDPFTLQTAAQTVMKSSDLIRLGNNTPPIFTTRVYRTTEASLDHTAQSMASRRGFAVQGHHTERAIAGQDARMRKAFGGHLSREQRAALKHILGDSQFSSVVGLAGAGKSTMLATARHAWAQQGITVHGAALAGKAADGLQSASGIQSRTLASLETSWENGYEPINKGEVLVVDEAGMIGTRQMARVAARLYDIGAKLVLVGDPDQLQPIEAGTPFRRLVERQSAAQLTEIHRQRESWQKQASRDLAKGHVAEAVAQYAERGVVSRGSDRETAIEALVENYTMDAAANGNPASRLAFAHKRKDVHALNQAIRAALRATDDPTPELLFTTDTGPRAFANTDRIVFTRNDRDIGVKNGMLGTITAVNEREITVSLDGDEPRTIRFNPRKFQSFDHGYAVTIHKSQGATVDHAYVLASRSMDRHLAYVAMTRHRNAMRLFINNEDRPVWASNRNRAQNPELRRHRDGPSIG